MKRVFLVSYTYNTIFFVTVSDMGKGGVKIPEEMKNVPKFSSFVDVPKEERFYYVIRLSKKYSEKFLKNGMWTIKIIAFS